MKFAADLELQLEPTKMIAWRRLRLAFGVLIAACFLVSGCAKSEKQIVEAPPAYQPSPAAPTTQLPKLPAQLTEVQGAVKRVFKDAAILDSSREPNFIAGDFNGDLSQDVAVVLKPASGKIQQMNEEYPPWILNDLLVAKKPGMPPHRIEESEVLLAVIHGHGVNDWRDPEATQTYLLKNAVGSGLKAHPQKEFVAANAAKKLPRLHGDLIGEVLRGTPGYVYYTGATYSWYDSKTFKGEPERRLVHGGPTVKVKN
jgi:hypothetical protein